MDTDPTPAPTTKRKRRASTPRAKSTIDPGIAAIRQKMALEVAAYRSQQASAKILQTILDKRLPKLTPGDRQKLFDELSKTETPRLPAGVGGQTQAPKGSFATDLMMSST